MHTARQPVPLLPGEWAGGGIGVCIFVLEGLVGEILAWVSVSKDGCCDLSLVSMYLCHLTMPRRVVIRALEVMKKLDPRGAFFGQGDVGLGDRQYKR